MKYQKIPRCGPKARVGFEAAGGERTISQMPSEFDVHLNQIRLWHNDFAKRLPKLFPIAGRSAHAVPPLAHPAQSPLFQTPQRFIAEQDLMLAALEWAARRLMVVEAEAKEGAEKASTARSERRIFLASS